MKVGYKTGVPIPKCINFKHFGECKGKNVGSFKAIENITSKQKCLDGCITDTDCSNIEYIAASNTCKYYKGKCS